jgi:hypothetical protein
MTKSITPYILIPQRLCMDVRDNPIAIGVYSLIARLFLVSHDSIPLSASDIQRFDAKVSYGQARRALERLVDTGWLLVNSVGRKNGYLPTWGRINGTCRPWRFGIEKFSRPPHVRCYRIEADQIDGIGYLTPHTSSTALVVAGLSTITLTDIGTQLLVHAGLRTLNMIDHLIDQSIDQPHGAETRSNASESQGNSVETHSAIPWESWESNQLINQPSVNQPSIVIRSEQQIIGGGAVEIAELDRNVCMGHQELNAGRILLPGEWFELAALQQTYGIKQLLIWQARVQRRQNPIERISPTYYRACAEQDAAEQIRAAKALKRAAKPRTHKANQSKPEPALPQAILADQRADQLNLLGIRIHSGLEACDPALLAAWVEASRQPDWALIWDDPGAAARAMLLLGKEPPSPALIARRAAAKKQLQPTDWSMVVMQSDGLARLGSDLSDIQAVASPNTFETGVLEEQLRMALRLHAPTRPAFQAVERLWVCHVADSIHVCAGRAEDLSFLRGLLPVMTRVLGQRPVVGMYTQS